MSRNHDFVSKKVAIVGRSGQGKSTFQRQLIRAWPADYTFGFDHKDEFQNKGGFYQCRTPEQCDAALEQTGFVNFRPTVTREFTLRKAFSAWFETVFALCKKLPGRKLIYFDESKRTVGTNAKLFESHVLAEGMETGREWGVDFLIAAQRPSHLVPDYRGQISQWVCFQMSAGWVKPLVEDYEEDFTPVCALNKGQYIAYDADSGEFERGESKPE
jgi:hypothetical protein